MGAIKKDIQQCLKTSMVSSELMAVACMNTFLKANLALKKRIKWFDIGRKHRPKRKVANYLDQARMKEKDNGRSVPTVIKKIKLNHVLFGLPSYINEGTMR